MTHDDRPTRLPKAGEFREWQERMAGHPAIRYLVMMLGLSIALPLVVALVISDITHLQMP